MSAFIASMVLGPVGCRIRLLQTPQNGTRQIPKSSLGCNIRSGRRFLSQIPSSSSMPPSPVPPLAGPGIDGAALRGLAEGTNKSTPPFLEVPEDILLLRKFMLSVPPPTATRSLAATSVLAQAPAISSQPDDRRTALLFQHLQASDSGSLYRWLLPTMKSLRETTQSKLDEERRQRQIIVANLPQTVFSELLRCLDPFVLKRYRDYAEDLPISQGMALFTPLRMHVDHYGVRRLFISLLDAFKTVYLLRLEAGHSLVLRDYVVLLRCAGAASDMEAAKWFWSAMEDSGYAPQRNSEAYREYVGARFLTETLYVQNAETRIRVRPVFLQNQKITMPNKRMNILDSLRRRLERVDILRFGQNPQHSNRIENLARVLSKPRPIRRVFGKAWRHSHANDQRMLAAAMIACARANSRLAMINILQHFFKVDVVLDRETGKYTVAGGAPFAAGSPLHPSAIMLDAVVRSFCCIGEVACALQTMGFLARRYNLVIPDRTWFILLEWTYIMASYPAKEEWRLCGLGGRAVKLEMVQMVWDTMTASPYNVQPGFDQYDQAIKALFHRNRYADVLPLMRASRLQYEAQLHEYEEAVMEYAEMARQGVDTRAAVRRMRKAETRKWYMRYRISDWFRKKMRLRMPREIEDQHAVRTIPDIVDEFRSFMPPRLKYHLATGTVQIELPPLHVGYAIEKKTKTLPSMMPHVRCRVDISKAGKQKAWPRQIPAEDLKSGKHGSDISAPDGKNMLRCRVVNMPQPIWSTPDLRELGSKTPREWLVREFI